MGFKKKTRQSIQRYEKWQKRGDLLAIRSGLKKQLKPLRKAKKLQDSVYQKLNHHEFWGDTSLRFAVLSCIDEFVQPHTTVGYVGVDGKIGDILNIKSIKITDEEVYAITEKICGYNPGGELFPPHLTREEAILFMEVTSMVEEAFYSVVLIMEKHRLSNTPYHNNWECNSLIGYRAGQKGEIIFDFLVSCDGPSTCYRCWKERQSKLNKITDIPSIVNGVAEDSVTAFRIVRKINERLNTSNIKSSEWVSDPEGKDPPFLDVKYSDGNIVLSLDNVKALASLTNKINNDEKREFLSSLTQNSLNLHAMNATDGSRSYLSQMDLRQNSVKSHKYEEYELIFDGLKHLMSDLDEDLYPPFSKPIKCDCKDCSVLEVINQERYTTLHKTDDVKKDLKDGEVLVQLKDSGEFLILPQDQVNKIDESQYNKT